MHLLTHETPDFITPALWSANSPDLNPVDYQIWWKLQDRVYRSHVTSTSWSRAWSKSGNISTRWSSIKRSGSGVHVLELAFDFEHTVDILNTDIRCADVLPFIRTDTHLTVNHACAYSGPITVTLICTHISKLLQLRIMNMCIMQLKFADKISTSPANTLLRLRETMFLWLLKLISMKSMKKIAAVKNVDLGVLYPLG